MKATIWHNPQCSKSRAALETLRARGDIELEVVEYLKAPPGRDKLPAGGLPVLEPSAGRPGLLFVRRRPSPTSIGPIRRRAREGLALSPFEAQVASHIQQDFTSWLSRGVKR